MFRVRLNTLAIRAVLVVALTIALALIMSALPEVLRYYGWHITMDAGEVAPNLIRYNRPVSECWNIIYFNLTPSPEEVKRGCVAQYASLAKDPAACEALLPSDYALQCLNYIDTQLLEADSDAAWVAEEEDCSSVPRRSLKQDRCAFLKAHRSHNPRDCRSIANNVLRAVCQVKMEAWEKYPDLRSSFEFGKYREGGSVLH